MMSHSPSIAAGYDSVPTEVFETPTFGLEVHCSIQLSYVGKMFG